VALLGSHADDVDEEREKLSGVGCSCKRVGRYLHVGLDFTASRPRVRPGMHRLDPLKSSKSEIW
jgi:hypothetical protein